MASRSSVSGPTARSRPISPHLTVYRWGPHMLVSILHRATGDGMATVGAALFVWWLAALAGGAASYGRVLGVFTTAGGRLNAVGYVVGVGLTLSLFQHLLSGIRHLVMDTGAAFELKRNKLFALATMIGAVALTAAYWLYLGIK